MDKNTIIGFGLIFLMLIGMQYFQNQNRVEAEAAQRVQDSIAQVQHQKDSIAAALEVEQVKETTPLDSSQQVLLDSLQKLQRAQSFGGFATAATGQEEDVILENDVLKITFSNKGGRIKSVLLKEYFKMGTVEEGDKKYPLYLLEDERNKFEYTLPMNNGTKVLTSDLYFDVQKSGKSVTFRAKASDNQYFEQKYTLTDGSYTIDYDLKTNGLNDVLASSSEEIKLNWENYLTKIERNVDYERRMSSVYFKTIEDDTDYCNCNKSDVERIEDERITWIAHSSQFFNSALMTTDVPFHSGVMETVVPETDADVSYLKKLNSTVNIPTGELADGFKMQFYIGPKDYKTLAAFDNELQYTVPFGISIFGTVNRYIVRPLFGFLLSFISSKGIVILVLTLIVKLVLFPLTYKMLYSQSKMGALKPQIAKVREKYKDDAQQQQMETMKMYREFGVNP